MAALDTPRYAALSLDLQERILHLGRVHNGDVAKISRITGVWHTSVEFLLRDGIPYPELSQKPWRCAQCGCTVNTTFCVACRVRLCPPEPLEVASVAS